MMLKRHRLPRRLLFLAALSGILGLGFEQPSVRVEPTDSVGPRQMEKQTQDAIVRDYLGAWESLGRALQQNRPDLLDGAFLGVAREKLAQTIQDQERLGIRTVYTDRSHDLRLLFYSPEGLSVQLSDAVEYDVQLMDHDKLLGTHHIRTRYVAILTPTEVRWKVRVFQAVSQ